MISRRVFVVLSFAIAAARAQAQTFPSGQVRIVVPFPPGGATDVLGRVLATHLMR
jgi:tripartite-type tricarboxylate transporter receptor subunit TctC